MIFIVSDWEYFKYETNIERKLKEIAILKALLKNINLLFDPIQEKLRNTLPKKIF